MERVAFLVERTGERIPCLLNPDSVVSRRYAGIRPVTAGGRRLTAADLSDDPLVFSGGGRTELELDLLFDTSLLPPPPPVNELGPEAPTRIPPAPVDVRSLTGPLWRLAENPPGEGALRNPPLARFVWGKNWNVLGVIVAVSERLEQFEADGTPGRSWLRLRMIRVAESLQPTEQNAPSAEVLEAAAAPAVLAVDAIDAVSGVGEVSHEVLGDGGSPPRGERLDGVAARYYPGQPWMWRYLAVVNDLDDAPWSSAGRTLRVPAAPDLRADSGAAGTSTDKEARP